jgi:hypothetical protein
VRIRFVSPLAALVLVVSTFATPAFAVIRTKLVSRFQGVDAIEADSSTFGGRAMSGKGRFVIFSASDDALPGADSTRDIYVRDRKRGRTRLVSKNSAGEPADADSSDAMAISQNGRFVAFAAEANNFPGSTDTQDVYVRNLRAGTTLLVSKTSNGEVLDGDSDNPSISSTGRFVAFESTADNLPGDDAYTDVYARDRRNDKTKLLSKTSEGTPANGISKWPSLSADGRRCSFQSEADNLPGPDSQIDVFVRSPGRTRLVSKTSSGEHLDKGSYAFGGSMSGNGSIVTFESDATNVPGGGNATTDVYLHGLSSGKTRLVSKTSQGVPADQDSGTASVSGNGRFIGFESDGENLPGAAGVEDVFLHDRRDGSTRLISRNTSGQAGNEESMYISVSADARFAAFSSRANNFSVEDNNDYLNVFARGPLR